MLLARTSRAPGPPDRPRPGRRRWRRRSRRATSDGPRLRPDRHRHRRSTCSSTSTKSLLRFITCGSVDDGKSTLIGRLLYESKMLFEDQLAALEADSQQVRHAGRRHRLRAAGRRPRRRARAGHHDRRRLPLLLHRPAQVHRRRHARPRAVHAQHGHRRLDRRPRRDPDRRAQGRADADAPPQLPRRRCSASATSCWRSTRWTWSTTPQAVFDAHRRRLPRVRRSSIGLERHHARSRCRRCSGDNMLAPSAHTPWYHGPTLMGYLETVEVDETRQQTRRRSACRCSGSTAPTSTSAASAGTHRQRHACDPGDRVRVLPSGRETHGRAHRHRRRRPAAGRRRPVGHADARRRDRRLARRRDLRAPTRPPRSPTSSRRRIVWMADEPLLPGRPYLLKIGTQHGHGAPSPSPSTRSTSTRWSTWRPSSSS